MVQGSGMTDRREDDPESGNDSRPRGYAAPRVEHVLAPDALEREVLYAGRPSGPNG
jgi:hypothetical protein